MLMLLAARLQRLVLVVSAVASLAFAEARDYRTLVHGREAASVAFPGLDDAIARELAAAGLDSVADRRVAEAAERLASFMVAQDPPRRPMHADRDDLIRAAGVLEHRCAISVFRGTGALPSAEPILASVRAHASRRQDKALVAYGVGVARGDAGRFVLVLVQAERFVAIDGPVPRVVAVDARAQLHGRLLSGAGPVHASILSPDGLVSGRDLGRGPDFALDLAFDRPGLWRVELSGTLGVGPFPLVNFPVYVGVPDTVVARPAAPFQDDEGAFVRELLGLVNATRASLGRGALELDARLSAAASSHASEMVRERYIGHESPTSGGPGDRIRRAGLVSSMIGENIGVGASPREVHEGLLASPGHRATLLDPDVTHVGFGLASEPMRDGCDGAAHLACARTWVVTEDFARIVRAQDPGPTRDRVLGAIGVERARLGLGALESEPRLESTAQAIVRTYVDGGATPEALANAAKRKCGKGLFPHTRVVGLRADEPLRFAAAVELADPRVDRIGLAMLQVSLPGEPENQWAIVAVIAQGTLPKVDAAARLEEIIAQAREARRSAGLGDLVLDPKVHAAAGSLARTLADGGALPRDAELFRTLGVRVRSARVQSGVVQPDGSIGSWSALLEPRFDAFGIGFAQGPAPGQPKNAHHVVVVGVTR